MDELEYGESRDGYVSNDEDTRDKITDILVAGADPHFINKQGIECNYKWIPCETKASLETKITRINLAYMASILEDQVPDSLDQIITHWCNMKQEKMTFRLLYTLLKHPGIIHNERAALLLEDMLQKHGQQVNIKL